MNAKRLQWCIMCPTDFWKKLRIYLLSSGLFIFLWVLAPPWQHFGCQFLCQLNLVKLYYQLIDLHQDWKDILGVKQQKLLKTMEILTVFVNFQLNQIQNCSTHYRSRKWKMGCLAFNWKKLLLRNVYRQC